MKNMNKRNFAGNLVRALLTCLLACFAASALAQVSLDDIAFAGLPGEQFQIDLRFSDTPPTPDIFAIDRPARLTIDFANTRNNLKERRYPLSFTGADSVTVLEAQGRTRLVVNLATAVPYTTSVKGNVLSVVVGRNAGGGENSATLTNAAGQGSRFVAPANTGKDIGKVDFRRGENNSGMVVIDLAKSNISAKVEQAGSRLNVEFSNASLDPRDQVKLDVNDFGTPVHDVSLYLQNGKVMLQANVTGKYDYLAYQTDRQYVLSITPLAAAGTTLGGAAVTPKGPNGDRISITFQSIDVRAALQIMADFNNFSLVVGNGVNGMVTLRLDNVPWDQALDMVLKSNKLDKRIEGSVMYVAPADEIATMEVNQLESTKKVEELAPLVTEYIPINYAQATDLVQLLQSSGSQGGGGRGGQQQGGAAASAGNGGILSERGKATVDARTNTIIVQDVEAVIGRVKALIAKLDVPVRQVLIEARIVNASTSFSQGLGIRWGGAQTFPRAGDRFTLTGGTVENSAQFGDSLSSYAQSINSAVAGGTPLATALATATPPSVGFPQSLVVDMGVNAPTKLALGYAGNNGLLQLELSALESSGNGEVIAQPKITTQDQQPANITSGVQIPYQSAAGGTAGGTTTTFIKAALTLDVTPQITPEGRIIMKLNIHQDSVVPGSGAIPAIATNSVETRVLVNNGDTVVLGGVYREEVTTSTTKTPLLGDIPYLGYLFKKKEDNKTKTELLIFITPSIITDLH
jgi:type IV pilus assembly protein PilQ